MTSTTDTEPASDPTAGRLDAVVAQADRARRDAADPTTSHRTRTNQRETT